MIKKLLSALLAALLTLSLAACNKDDSGNVDIPANQTGSADFQKNMHQSTSNDLSTITETDAGFYIQLKGAYIYYIEKGTKGITILCGKPECEHRDSLCNARLHAKSLWYTDGKLYFNNSDSVFENGTYTDRGDCLRSVEADGTNLRVVQDLEFTPGGDTSNWTKYPIQHRGIVYFTYSGIVYAMPLGGDIEKDAVAVWGEESEDAGQGFNLSAPQYTLWADGDTMYFMVNIPQTDGTYKDTLFAYDPETGVVTQVWQTPDADEVGEWISTGVYVSKWYVLDGTIYFYLSGGDFWKTDLATGETAKLANTSDKTKYGEAIFSDDYLCLMNSTPESKDGQQYGIGGNNTIGGNTIYVYGLDGSFIKELSLKPLYDQFGTLESCKLAFCSGSDIYFVADASTQSWSGGVGTMHRNMNLCCVNIETGEITQIYNWD